MLEPKDEIKQKLDIAEVVGEYLQLKPAGSGSLKALCPFHGERTPSFHVSRERQTWHCFGCDKGGDMFSFVMEMDGLTFPEALRHLADKAGVMLPEYKKTPQSDERERLRDMHEVAAVFYHETLREGVLGEKAREYVKTRGIPDDLRDAFRLGAAPEGWDALVTVLRKKGFSEEEMVKGGLALRRRSGNGVVDRFRGRLMVPLASASGAIVGFTARQLPGVDDNGPKYMNSPETPIYKKGEMLFGLHLAKTGIREKKEIIVVEGNLDVIASHKAGVTNVVASSGTALTEAQLRILSRYTKRIVFALDEDAAGFAAAKRVLDLALHLQQDADAPQFSMKCLVIPEGVGKDPDEIVAHDPALWQRLARQSEDVIEYVFTKRLRLLEGQSGAANIAARQEFIDEILPYLARVARPDVRHLYLLRVSDATHVDLASLDQMLSKHLPRVAQSHAPTPVRSDDTEGKKTTRVDRAFGFLFALAMKYEGFVPEILEAVNEHLLTEGEYRVLYNALKTVYTSPESLQGSEPQPFFSRLLSWLTANGYTRETSVVNALALRSDELLDGLSPQEVRREADRNLSLVSQEFARNERQALERDIREAELSGDNERLHDLVRAYRDMIARQTE